MLYLDRERAGLNAKHLKSTRATQFAAQAIGFLWVARCLNLRAWMFLINRLETWLLPCRLAALSLKRRNN